MNKLALDWDEIDEERVRTHVPPRSETRLRTVLGCEADMALAVSAIEVAIQRRGTSADNGILTSLRMVERATIDLERWTRTLGASHVTEPWLEKCTDWLTAVSETLQAALSYEGAERDMALELAAEESSTRLLMGLEREGTEAVAMLRNLDSGAARAAAELVARVDLADRMLHARVTSTDR
jgi:hypothetical protein